MSEPQTHSTLPGEAPLKGAARRELADGWPTVLAAALAIGVGMMGIGFYSLGLFVTPVQEEFGWSRGAASGAATFQQLGIFLSAPLVGRLADRIGTRPIAIASYIATPIAMLVLAQAGPSIPAWYALWLVVSLAGCGTTPAIWARLVSMKFNAARGLSLGIMLMGSGAAAVLAPALIGPIIVDYGWRTGVLAMAVTIAVIGLPVSFLTARDAPARLGREKGAPRGHFERHRETMMIAVIAMALGLIVAGLIVHLVPMLIDRGVPAGEAAGIAAVIGIAVIAARVVVGWLFDRFHAPYVAVLFLLSPVIACVILRLDGPAIPAALMLGLAAGAEVDMLAYFTSRYARLANYGATYGVILGLFSFGAALGPPLFGWSVDWTGSYARALELSALALIGVLVLIARLGPYRRPD